MPRHSVTAVTDALITSTRGPSLYAAAAAGASIRQVEVWNTTATDFTVGLIRWTATGTQGTALTEAAWDQNRVAPQCTAFNTHTANATAGDVFASAPVGAAIGSGIIWVFGDSGLVLPEGTTNGIGLYLPTGTAQHLRFTFVWDE
jgi:hypothetical protein